MEGSDSRDKSYKCNGEGEYTLPIDALSGLPEFPSCIPRRMNCFLRYYTFTYYISIHVYLLTYIYYILFLQLILVNVWESTEWKITLYQH